MIYWAIEEDGEIIREFGSMVPVLYGYEETANNLCLDCQKVVKVKIERVEK